MDEELLAKYGFRWDASARVWRFAEDENSVSLYVYPAPDYEAARAAALEYIRAVEAIDMREECWLTTREAAELLGRPVRHVRELIREGRLGAQRTGRRGRWWVWRPSVLEYKAHLRALERGAAVEMEV